MSLEVESCRPTTRSRRAWPRRQMREHSHTQALVRELRGEVREQRERLEKIEWRLKMSGPLLGTVVAVAAMAAPHVGALVTMVFQGLF